MSPDAFAVRRVVRWCGIGAGVACAALLYSGQGRAQSATATSAAQPSAPPRHLAFDLEGDTSAITAFIVGYFSSGEKTPAFSFEVPRARVESITPRTMRIPLIVGSLPEGQTYEIRLRTVVREQQSAWSTPSGSFTVPPNATSSVGIPLNPRGRSVRPARSAVQDLESAPALSNRLSSKFPEVEVMKAATGFRSVQDLAAALFAASNLRIPFAEIKKLTADKGNRNLQRAIETLKPRANGTVEARRARNQARRFLSSSGK
jgi:hypothetical protein